MSAILDALSDVGYAADTPGALLRGLLAGRPGSRASGEELLDTYGLPGGALGGFAAEMVLDPLALAGPALGAYRGIRGLTRAGTALSHADDVNPLLRGIGHLVGDEEGALRPFMEIGRRSDPDYVNAATWFHGTRKPDLTPEMIDPKLTNPFGLFGPGFYETQSPSIAQGYTKPRRGAFGVGAREPTVYAVGNDYGKILDMDVPAPEAVRSLILDHVEGYDRINRHFGDFSQEYAREMPTSGNPTSGEMYKQFRNQIVAFLEGEHDPEAGESLFELAFGLRQRGYDALTHTGGLGTRSGRAFGPHQVVIGLDPNDLYSSPGLGRSGQIRFLKSIHPEALADLIRWDREHLLGQT